MGQYIIKGNHKMFGIGVMTGSQALWLGTYTKGTEQKKCLNCLSQHLLYVNSRGIVANIGNGKNV